MSFFYDFLDEIGIGDNKDFYCFIVFGKGVSFVGNYKIISMEQQEIELEIKKKIYVISGSDLSVKSMGKGEIVIRGNISGVVMNEG